MENRKSYTVISKDIAKWVTDEDRDFLKQGRCDTYIDTSSLHGHPENSALLYTYQGEESEFEETVVNMEENKCSKKFIKLYKKTHKAGFDFLWLYLE